jgi:Ni,Fe-hydrogenase III small subunit
MEQVLQISINYSRHNTTKANMPGERISVGKGDCVVGGDVSHETGSPLAVYNDILQCKN